MKALSGAAVYDDIRKNHVNSVLPVLVAEWNMNRYYRTVVDNTPSEDTDGFDIEMFPIESITLPDRPTSGINKAVVGQALVSENTYHSVPTARYYTASVRDQYKYWQSPLPSATTAPFDIADCAPQVLYVEEEDVDEVPVNRTIKANKISFTVENTYAYPDVMDVQVKTTTTGSWVTVASNPVIPANGKVELWYDGSAWTTTKNINNIIDVHAVRLVVSSMAASPGVTNFAGAYFNLIELGFRLELDLSVDLINVSDQFNIGESDFITPVGTISSNTATFELMNEHRKYTNDNTGSLLYGLLDKNVQFNLEYQYGSEKVQQFRMYTENWNEGLDTTTVTLADQSKFFMDSKPRPLLYRDVPVQEAVWRLCDSLGFNNYNVDWLDTSPSATIDIFWTDGEQTAWDVFQELSRGTQTAIYFDAYGVLQIKTREAAFNNSGPVWTLREFQSGDELPDIESLSEQDQWEPNKVTISYQPTNFSEKIGNVVPFEVVWQPEGDTVLRASNLIKDLLIEDTAIRISPKESATWPFKGMCQIQGEWISYEGKVYGYYDGQTKKWGLVKSLAEQKALDEKSPEGKRHLNGYVGALSITERGLWNTEPQNHYVDANGWITRRIQNYLTPGQNPASGFRHNKRDSSVTLRSPAAQRGEDYFYVYRGNAVDQGWKRIGTRMKIDKTSHVTKSAGIFFNADGPGEGYFVDLMATARMSGNVRKTRNEIIFYSMKADGSKKKFGGEIITVKDDSQGAQAGATVKTDVGAEFAVVMDRYIEIDVYVNTDATDHKIQVWADNRLVIDATVPDGSGWQQPSVSRFGMFVRGASQATFDYIYASYRGDTILSDEEVFQDRIEGGYMGQQWQRDFVYETRIAKRKVRRKWTKVKQKYLQRYFDEFGPVVHEIREFEVKYDTNGLPVLESKLYNTNEHQSVCTEFVHDVAGATFILANTSRHNAVVNGEDTLSARGEGSIDQKLMVYGRPVIQKDTEEIVKTDDWAVRRRGIIDVEYASKWIQNKDAAERLGDWLIDNWARSDSTVDVSIFGNPLIELGDVVAIQYGDMTPETHEYFVVGISNSFDAGLDTRLTLRRAV